MATGRFDMLGAVLGALGLAGITYALIEAPDEGAGSPPVLAAAVVGVAALVGVRASSSRASAAPDAAAVAVPRRASSAPPTP